MGGFEHAVVLAAREAMATRFEVAIFDSRKPLARAAADEALDEVSRLEGILSAFHPESEIYQVNAEAARRPVAVRPEVFGLLRHAVEIGRASGGAFDITIGPLMHCWGFRGPRAGAPDRQELDTALAVCGLDHIMLDERSGTVSFDRPGVGLDLGGIGKGYAVERAAAILREAGVRGGLIHGGTSSIQVVGDPPAGEEWCVGVPTPAVAVRGVSAFVLAREASDVPMLTTVGLREESLSLSGIWGRRQVWPNASAGHVIHPRTGRPVRGAVMAVVIGGSAIETDAWSTALLADDVGLQGRLAAERPSWRTLLVRLDASGKRLRIDAVGIDAPTAMAADPDSGPPG
jgi:FAD:protein FMN transferase